MNREKAGPDCSEEQAVGLLDELLNNWPTQRFPNYELLVKTWTERFRSWPYRYARAAVDAVLEEHKGPWPQWAELHEIMNTMGLRDQEEAEVCRGNGRRVASA
jgi:hypothetical protein